jgi:hypothetical protein
MILMRPCEKTLGPVARLQASLNLIDDAIDFSQGVNHVMRARGVKFAVRRLQAR